MVTENEKIILKNLSCLKAWCDADIKLKALENEEMVNHLIRLFNYANFYDLVSQIFCILFSNSNSADLLEMSTFT
jgi:hypothetical protein